MTLELARQIRRNATLRGERTRECLYVLGEAMIALAAEAHVQIVSFAKTPAVAFEIVAKIKLGPLTRDGTLCSLRCIQLELDLLRTDGAFFLTEMRPEKTGHR